MRQEKINQLLKDNYKIKVFIKINNRSNGMVLNTWIYKNNNCYEVYYNHIKTHPVIFVNSDLINELLGIINQLEQKKKKPNKVILSGNMVEINISKES